MTTSMLATLFESLPVGVIVLDAQGRVVVFNAHEEKLAGRRRENVMGREFFREVAPCMDVRELSGTFYDGIGKVRLEQRIDFSFPFPHALQPRDVLVRLESFESEGAPFGLLLVEDVSAERAVARMKDELAKLLVHDFKSPLSAVITNLSWLQEELLKVSRADLVEGVADALAASDRLHAMILDLLDVTRLQTGSFPLKRRLVPVHTLMEAATLATARTASFQEVTVTAEVEEVQAEIDDSVLRRVVDNLIDNALRHVRKGGRVLGRVARDGNDLVMEIRDDGPGVPAELRERIFDPYAQVSGAANTASNRGLGLSFVQMAVRAHGGTITVTDAVPHGACFTIRIPLQAPATP